MIIDRINDIKFSYNSVTIIIDRETMNTITVRLSPTA